MTELFAPYSMAGRELRNRITMAPMTRARRPDLIADGLTARYYAQRASAGLIITEGTPVSPEGQGYIDVPGIWTSQQASGWSQVADAVHAEGGTIFAQLWHVGRMSHVSLQPEGGAPVSASAIAARDARSVAWVRLDNGEGGFSEVSVPRALSTEEVARVTQDFAKAAHHAKETGFDGVELHGANGYLFEQFFNPLVNDRSDQYGGSVENRVRFALETIDALVDVLGAARVGIRISPFSTLFDMPRYDGNAETYLHLARELDKRQIAYIHLNDNAIDGESVIPQSFLKQLREAFTGTVILAGGMTGERAQRMVDENLIDLPAFGQPFIANPDLVERLRTGAALNEPDRDTYYGGGAKGYTDYPTLVNA